MSQFVTLRSPEHASRSVSGVQQSLVERLVIDPNPRTRKRFNFYFDTSVNLDQLLKRSESELEDVKSAKLWLLSQWSELASILGVASAKRNKTMAIVNHFVRFWLKHHSPIQRLNLPRKCSFNATKSSLHLGEDIGLVRVKHPEMLRINHHHRERLPAQFVLMREHNSFVVEVSYQDRAAKSVKSHRQSTPFSLAVPHRGKSHADQLFQAMNQLAKESDLINRSFVSTDYTRLHGRPVPGGLPSLGVSR